MIMNKKNNNNKKNRRKARRTRRTIRRTKRITITRGRGGGEEDREIKKKKKGGEDKRGEIMFFFSWPESDGRRPRGCVNLRLKIQGSRDELGQRRSIRGGRAMSVCDGCKEVIIIQSLTFT